MSAFHKFDNFVQDLGRKVHNLDSDALKYILSNVAPAAANAVKADVTEISAGNGYTAGGAALSSAAYSQSAGLASLTADPVTWTASGGSINTFRYVILYNDTPTSPADPLIGWIDLGRPYVVASGFSFRVTLDADGIQVQ